MRSRSRATRRGSRSPPGGERRTVVPPTPRPGGAATSSSRGPGSRPGSRGFRRTGRYPCGRTQQARERLPQRDDLRRALVVDRGDLDGRTVRLPLPIGEGTKLMRAKDQVQRLQGAIHAEGVLLPRRYDREAPWGPDEPRQAPSSLPLDSGAPPQTKCEGSVGPVMPVEVGQPPLEDHGMADGPESRRGRGDELDTLSPASPVEWGRRS